MPEIQTERLRHRVLSKEDLDGLMSIVGDPDVMKYLGIEAGTILNRKEAETALSRMIAFRAKRGFGRWAVFK